MNWFLRYMNIIAQYINGRVGVATIAPSGQMKSITVSGWVNLEINK